MTDQQTCRSCGSLVSPGAAFCAACGSAVTQASGDTGTVESLESLPGRCPACDAPVSRADRFCRVCGHAQAGRTSGDTGGSTGRTGPSIWEGLRAELVAATAGDFEIVRELGRGAMGAVYLANDLALTRRVAIKVIAPQLLEDERMVERFRLEARTIASLRHPNIVTVYTVRSLGNLHYFVMDYIEGTSLRSIIKGGGALPIAVSQALLFQVGSALDYAHGRGRGVIHRDVKPANIMVSSEGNAVVTDFGISKVAEGSGHTLTGTGLIIGTPEYMSPEQCTGATVTGAADQYALGIVAYEMLTGRAPFYGGQVSVLMSHMQDAPEPIRKLRPDCPEEIARAVERMLLKRPEERWPSVDDAVTALGGRPLHKKHPVREAILRIVAGTMEGHGDLHTLSPLSPIPGTLRSGGPPTEPTRAGEELAPFPAGSPPTEPALVTTPEPQASVPPDRVASPEGAVVAPPSVAPPVRAPEPRAAAPSRSAARAGGRPEAGPKPPWMLWGGVGAAVLVLLVGSFVVFGGGSEVDGSDASAVPPVESPDVARADEADAAPPQGDVSDVASGDGSARAAPVGTPPAAARTAPAPARTQREPSRSRPEAAQPTPAPVSAPPRNEARPATPDPSASPDAPRAARVMLTLDAESMGLGTRQNYSVRVLDAEGRALDTPPGDVAVTSTEPSVLAVGSGWVEGRALGTAYVVSAVGSVADSMRVSVTARIERVEIVGGDLALEVGGSADLVARAYDAGGAGVDDATIAWTSSDVGVVGIDAISGLATAAGPGNAQIVARSGDARATVNVVVAEPRAVAPPAASLGDRPTFTPFTAAPELQNQRELQRAIEREYPAGLSRAGVGGTVLVNVFVDETGVVQNVALIESSGRVELDDAALVAARVARFSPARNGDDVVPVWFPFALEFLPSGR